MMRKLSSTAKNSSGRLSRSRDVSSSNSPGHRSLAPAIVLVSAFAGYVGYALKDLWNYKIYNKRHMKLVEERTSLHKLLNEKQREKRMKN